MTKENYNEQMEFPDTWEEFEEFYGFYDTEEVYTNNSRLIPSFRVKQWLEHYKKEPCGDCISRKETLKALMDEWTDFDSELMDYLIEKVKKLPPVTPQPREDVIIDEHYWKGFHNGIRTEKFRESKRQEPWEDAISRQAVIDTIDKWVKNMHVLIALPANEVTLLFESVHELPPVTPQPKMGQWIKTSLTEVSGGDFKRGFRCSHCNYVIVTNDFNFCPNCGAKMQEVEE